MNLLIASPVGCRGSDIPAAAIRSGGIGLLNLTFLQSPALAVQAARELASTAAVRSGLILHGRLGEVEGAALDALGATDTILLFPEPEAELQEMADHCRSTARCLGLVATCVEDAQLADRLGFDLVVAKGSESGGIVGEETTYVLLQHLLGAVNAPIVAWGGVGLNTMAACASGGAAGVLLDWQLALTRECALPLRMRERIAAMDATESVVVNGPSGRQLRLFWRPGMTARDELQQFSRELSEQSGGADSQVAWAAWRERIATLTSLENVDERAWLIGQDGAFAFDLARRGRTVGAAMARLREQTKKNLAGAAAARALGPDGPLARSHGTRFPIVQGPMTRVSDVAPFSLAVAEAGALPLAALALMRGEQVRQLLEHHRELLADRPWGAGVLGFVDHEVWQDQVRVIEEVRPPFALVAGGRPDQARALEARGIRTYLHVASPEVLREYVREGARRFVFEGRECGGHVGPRTSFVLWESCIRVLLEMQLSREQMADLHVLFAGGIHDDRSAAMVAALAQPLVERGVKIGVLIGTAYLFTHEIVTTGAVVPGFQQVALETEATVLLETGPGHSTRCAPTSFYRDFCAAKAELLHEQRPLAELRAQLEQLNLGRLRIGAKGIERQSAGAAGLVHIDETAQRQRGMYMLGQVAALHRETFSVRDLHENVSEGACRRLDSLSRLGVAPAADEPRPAAFDIAIVGMSCFMPGASNLAQFWERILAGKDSIVEIPPDRFDWHRRYDATGQQPDHFRSRWGGFLDDISFDPLKYGIPPASIPSIEPMQLLALELVDSALRDSGCDQANPLRRRTSVVLGVGGGLAELGNKYVFRALLPEFVADPRRAFGQQLPEWTEDSFAGILLNVVAGRVADRFDLGGMNMTVDAACASSLAAVYVACSELTSGASDMVIAGGCDTLQNPMGYQCFDSAGALSPRGRCRPFDASADGIAISEGLTAVVLKRREDAERDGDRIYAIIRGVGTGSDGRTKGLTAPGAEGQRRTLDRAYRQAKIDPATVTLFEAHGTGTARGDVVEATTLGQFLTDHGAQSQSCAIGSVKSNVGHTKCAAGVAGLIKAALSLFHGVLPPTLHVEQPNPEALSTDGPLYVSSELRPWIQASSPRRAGVSAFGFGGTNFHAVLEEYTEDAGVRAGLMPRRQVPAELFLFSGASPQELSQQLAEARDLVRQAERESATLDLSWLAYRVHRLCRHAPSSKRVAIVAETVEQLNGQIEWLIAHADLDARRGTAAPAGVYLSDATAGESPSIAFMFPGQGAQFPRMLEELAVHFGEVRRAFEHLDRTLGRAISSSVFPPPAFDNDQRSREIERLMATDVAQPALGACGVGLTRLLASLGIRPKMTAGHSYGELTALYAAGSLDEASLYRLSRDRAEAMLSCDGAQSDVGRGAMLAVRASEAAARSELAACEGVFLANVNGPRQVVISGRAAAVRTAQQRLEARGIATTPLAVKCAFHTPHMLPAGEQFAEACARTSFQPPNESAFCNVTAAAHGSDVAAIRARLVEHLTSPVRFAEMVEAMYAGGARLFLEVGPSDILSKLVGEILGSRPHETIPLQAHDQSGLSGLLHGLARLFAAGVNVDADRLYEGRIGHDLESDSAVARASQRRSGTTWLINGAYARPEGSPRPAQPPLVSVAEGEDAVPRVSHEVTRAAAKRSDRGAHRRAPATPVPKAPSRPDIPAAQASGNDATSEVVLQFQRNMRELLMEQASVMRLYLGASPAASAGLEEDARETVEADGYGSPSNGDRDIVRPPRRKRDVIQRPVANPARRQAQPAPLPAMAAEPAESEDLAKALVRLTSEKTGYPPSALTLDARLEADLGIDSIKRVEIVTALRRQVAPEVAEPPQWFVRRMISAGSLQDIVDGVRELKQPQQPAPAQRREPAPAEDLARVLVRLTAEKTGYPQSALSLDARLEADLGIDSIKRVEIVTALRRQVAPEVSEPPQWFVRRMISAGSLQDIVAGVRELLGQPATASDRVLPAMPALPAIEELPEAEHDGSSLVSQGSDNDGWRWVPTAVDAPPAEAVGIPEGTMVVTDDGRGVAERFVQFCKANGRRAMLLRDEALTSRDNAVAALAEIRRQGSLAGVLHLAPLSAAPVFPHMDDGEWQQRLDREVKSLLFLAQALAPELTSRAESHAPTLLAAASIGGGQFAPQQSNEVVHPWRGGLAGILKTAALEWPAARCRAVDFDGLPDISTLWEELRLAGPVEIGYREERRLSLSAVAAPLENPPAELSGLDSESIVLVTGGARGITAEVVKELAARTAATMILLGRTPLSPQAESAETAALDDPLELRRVMARLLAQAGAPPSALEIDGAVKQLQAQREIRATLSSLQQTGSRARYIQCDVRSYESLAAAVASVRAQYGEITAVLHGAGVIEDRLLLDKTAESFDRVVGTKLQPMLHLCKLLDRERLRHLVLFSSTAAFWGNPGQVDYAAANEILNRIGRHLSDVWPGKTTAIGWGPWSGGGMVTPAVAREFAKHGIPLVPVAEGRVAAWRELVSPGREARVLIGRGPWSDTAASDANGAGRESLFYSTFSGAKDPIPAPARERRLLRGTISYGPELE